eukprot:TRINITY_DN3853_c0_g1_i3.p1 TRINITY_DN3853_c0_g1~~TRINITY_DN3853_c0_g1_i3.p1  ORF type:complete len:700 (-),score=172.98 TRINITY_DN3853_c0_g1_i3:147-2246(-)
MPLSSNMQALKRSRSEQANNVIKTRNKFFKEIKYNKEDALWDINQNQLGDDFDPEELQIKEGQKIWEGVKQANQNKKSFSQVFDRINEWKRERALLPDNNEQAQDSNKLIKKTPQEMKEFLNRSCSLLKNMGKDEDLNEEVKLEIVLPKMSHDTVMGNTLFINKMTRTQSILKNFQGAIRPQPNKQMNSNDIKEQLRESIKLRKSRNLTMEDVKKRFLITTLDDWEPTNKKNTQQKQSKKQVEKTNDDVDEQPNNKEEELLNQMEDKNNQISEVVRDNQQSSENEDQEDDQNKDPQQLDIEQIIELEEENEEDESQIEDNNNNDDDEQQAEDNDEEEEEGSEYEQDQQDQQDQQNKQNEQDNQDQPQSIQQEQQQEEDTPQEQEIEQKSQKLKKLRTVAQKMLDRLEEQKIQKAKQRQEREKKREQQDRLARNPKTKEALRKMLEMEAELGSDHEDHDDIIKQINRDDESERDSNADERESNNGIIDDIPLLPSEADSQAVWEKFQQDILDQEKKLLEKVLKGSFKGQKRKEDMIDLYDNEFTKRKLQMVQERIKELQDKDPDTNTYKERSGEKGKDEGSLFSDDDEEDQERQHLLQVEMELKRKILTEHPIRLDEEQFVDPEIMKKVVYVHPYQERDTFGKLMTPKKSSTNNNNNNLSNSNTKRLMHQQQKPFWQQQTSQLQKQIFTQSNFNLSLIHI